jgi:uncharacterized protein with HEPN domain
MDNSVKAFLYDIQTAIQEIESFFENEAMSFECYAKDIKTKRAVERDIEIIGEATYRILQTAPDFSLSNARRIIDMRNRIIHGYDTVSDEIVWSVITKHIPLLKAELEKLLH